MHRKIEAAIGVIDSALDQTRGVELSADASHLRHVLYRAAMILDGGGRTAVRPALDTIEKRRATYLRVVADGYWPRVIEIPRQASERPEPPPRAA